MFVNTGVQPFEGGCQIMSVKTPLYQITLYDQNCSPISDGVARFFTHDPNEFKKAWEEIGSDGRVDQDTIDRFNKSLSGVPTTDYWTQDEALDIVQFDPNAIKYAEKKYTLKDKTFIARNAYMCPAKYQVGTWSILFCWIKFKDNYYRIVFWVADNVKQQGISFNWEKVSLWGNPVIKQSGDLLYTICGIENKKFDNVSELLIDIQTFDIDKNVMDTLFKDVIGEAG